MRQSRRTVARNWNSWRWRESSGKRAFNSRVRGTGSGSAVLTGESSSRRPSFQVNVSGQVSLCAGEERSSLFSDSGNRFPSLNHFAAVLSLLSPAERYEAEFIGASEFLIWKVNEELQRVFEAEVPAFQVYHIGTPSEHTTSEGFQRTPSVHSHPTSSLISFGPSTPVQSASAPAGFLTLEEECLMLEVL